MKTAAKVFLILSIIGSAILIFVGGFTYLGGTALLATDEVTAVTAISSGISNVVSGLISLIFSIVSLVKLNKATCADDYSVGFRIVTLLFANIIAGIILLCMKDKDFQN